MSTTKKLRRKPIDPTVSMAPIPVSVIRRYHLACFLLDNLAAGFYFSWPAVDRARTRLARQLEVQWYAEKPGTWRQGRPEPVGTPGRLFTGMIECSFCGTCYGRRIHYSSKPNYRKVLWECQVSYSKCGTCPTGWLLDEVFKWKQVEFLQLLLREDPQVVAMVRDTLVEASRADRLMVLGHVSMILGQNPRELITHADDVRACLERGLITANRQLLLWSLSGLEITLKLPKRWHSGWEDSNPTHASTLGLGG